MPNILPQSHYSGNSHVHRNSFIVYRIMLQFTQPTCMIFHLLATLRALTSICLQRSLTTSRPEENELEDEAEDCLFIVFELSPSPLPWSEELPESPFDVFSLDLLVEGVLPPNSDKKIPIYGDINIQ